VPISRGTYSEQQIYATLGQITSGQKPGREDDKSITVFDSTGLAIQDIAVAKLIYGQAKERHMGFEMHLVE